MNRLKAQALTEMAGQAWSLGMGYKSIPLLSEALRRDPTNPDILVSLAIAHGKQRNYAAAEELLARLLKLAPGKAKLQHRAAKAYSMIDRPERAIECYRRSLELNRDTSVTQATLLELAALYERHHRLEEASGVIDELLRRDPGHGSGQLQQAILHRRSGAVTQAESQLRSLSESDAVAWPIRAQAAYELSQLLDQQDSYDEAFRALLSAKQTMAPHASQCRAQCQATLRQNQQLLESLNATHYERWHELAAHDTPYRCAVLTSHPRSGTTLLEQVLDSHPGLTSADELDIFSQWVQAPIFRRFPPNSPVLAVLERVPAAVRTEARATYIGHTESTLDEPLAHRLLLDKNPGMTIMLPVVNWAFPEMKILFALRDPRDVVLSCLMQKVPLTPISSNWLTLADAAEYYARVMRTWLVVRHLTTSSWLEVRYEDVVADLEGQARRVLEFLNLDWDTGVLKFHEHAKEKAARSPTYRDVTQPIYQRSVGRWRHYESYLRPIFAALTPWVREFAYDS